MSSYPNASGQEQSNENKWGHGTFQPLFTGTGSDGQCDDPKAQEAKIEQARSRGTLKGLEAGREEACRMARGGLSPSLKAFIHSLNDLSISSQQIKEQVSAKIVELALSICERVVGMPSRLPSAALSDLKNLLGNALSELNRITLHLNPEDVRAIEVLSAADGLEWPNYPQVIIESDALVPPGELSIAPLNVSRQSIDSSALSALTELLSK